MLHTPGTYMPSRFRRGNVGIMTSYHTYKIRHETRGVLVQVFFFFRQRVERYRYRLQPTTGTSARNREPYVFKITPTGMLKQGTWRLRSCWVAAWVQAQHDVRSNCYDGVSETQIENLSNLTETICSSLSGYVCIIVKKKTLKLVFAACCCSVCLRRRYHRSCGQTSRELQQQQLQQSYVCRILFVAEHKCEHSTAVPPVSPWAVCRQQQSQLYQQQSY